MNTMTISNERNYLAMAQNYFVSVIMAFICLHFYTVLSRFYVGYYSVGWQPQIDGYKWPYTITTPGLLWGLYGFYLVYAGFTAVKLNDQRSKPFNALMGIFKAVSRAGDISQSEKQDALLYAVKFFFVPFIINAFLSHIRDVNYLTVDLYKWFYMDDYYKAEFLPDLTRFALKIGLAYVYLMDVIPFVFGYLTEREGSQVKSVDYSVAGWFFCIMCYPPFNNAFSNFLPTVVPEYVQPIQGAQHLHMVLNGIAFLLLLGYASASVSLGFKATNLTSRGVVDTGLYGYIRHPAYVCKNLAWWVFAGGAAYQNAVAGKPYVFQLLALAVWSWIYAQRAITEEQHLIATDPEYLTYMQEVPYRFIPRLI